MSAGNPVLPQVPPIRTPAIDATTGLFTAPWQRYFAMMQANAGSNTPNGPPSGGPVDLSVLEAMDSGSCECGPEASLLSEYPDVQASLALARAKQAENLALLFLMDTPSSGGSSGGTILSGTHAARAGFPASSYPNALYFETDRTVFYISLAGTWTYATGQCQSAQSGVSGIIATLGTADAGFLLQVTDFGHLLKWSGAAFAFAPGDGLPGGAGPILFEVDPTGAGWHLYDGATVSYLLPTGSTTTKTLPNLSGAGNTAAYTKIDSANSGPNAPTSPSGTGGATSTNFTGATIPTNTGINSAAATVASGAGASVAANTHTHSEGTLSDPGHAHTVSSITFTSPGEPENITRRAWFRQ